MTRSSLDTQPETISASQKTPRTRHLDPPDILTVEEAAVLLRVNRKTLYELIRFGRPQWAIRLGRVIRISRTALLEAFRGKGSPALGDKR